ncbi:TetR/AcrR family transcriptional repressor of nem operon [Pedobacter sp. W3I1]|uniref:TetR/AcrR family transcriptional regulator n=1 Tax=Pedobacter sp. W3I1 TaxID=3042291 RepID=UPI0027881C02|nr:TetR/AcrR family transcriptional regulator [Pedobacter sp. W3I1]MDQ0640002.1 TetR/AcrR family transcriptional repressor of nem operon [Pedobacter sp. W3I1]
MMSKAANTKYLILTKSLDLIYKKGYQATSVDDIIATTNLTKGAFFYHFKSKEDMGLAIINEIFYPKVREEVSQRLEKVSGITSQIYKAFHFLLLGNRALNIIYGCPVVNLIEEMSPISEPFRKSLNRLIKRVQQALELALTSAQMKNEIRKDVDPRRVAIFLLTGYSGVRNMGKVLGKESYVQFLRELKFYLNNLK